MSDLTIDYDAFVKQGDCMVMANDDPDIEDDDDSSEESALNGASLGHYSRDDGGEGSDEEEENFEECGRSEYLTDRIVGGTTVRSREYPWAVALRLEKSKTQFCGASLINKWVN